MRLISLKANNSSFRPVIFKNKTGLNLIVAEQNLEGKNSNENSFNGVGKSLLMAIIQFCLGSNQKTSFKTNLAGWEFFLEFEIKGEQYISSRNTSNQKQIVLNSENLNLTTFNKKLESLLFDIPEDLSTLSFRALIPFFYRPRRASYLDFRNPNTLKSDYQVLLTNSFLLGIDIFLVKEKFVLKQEKDRIKDLLSQLNSDPVLKEFFIGDRDSTLAIQELIEKISALETDLKSFNIAEDYHEIKKDADILKRKIESLQNEVSLLDNQIINIQKSLESSPDISKDKIIRIYEESKINFSQEIKKTLDDLDNFYVQITKNRVKRLSNQKQEILREIEAKTSLLKQFHKEFDEKLQYLDSHQALDVFVKLTNMLSDLKSERGQIENYQKLLKEYHTTKLEIDKKFIDATSKTDQYLTDVFDYIKGISDFFRALAKNFYPHSLAGLSINNNDKENSIRFNFDARIESDSSDGISNVKIFCYDLTILLLGQNHNMESIFHDSRILDGIDPRQLATLFKVANEYITNNNKQYIITMNQNHLDEIQAQLSEEDFKNIILNNICHRIGDDCPENKLLGIQIDMKYEA